MQNCSSEPRRGELPAGQEAPGYAGISTAWPRQELQLPKAQVETHSMKLALEGVFFIIFLITF